MTDNARPENAERSKMLGWKMQDRKMRHQTAMVENAGLENGATAFYGTPCIT